MKKFRLLVLLFPMMLFLYTACDKSEDTPVIDTMDADLETTFDDTFEEVDAIVDLSLASYDMHGRIGGSTEGEMDALIGCAATQHDAVNKKITLDFGDGCIGLLGRERKGIIYINYTDKMFIPGSEVVITFEDFYINGVKVEGVRTRKNLSGSVFEAPEFYVKLENGKLTWPEEQGGGYAEREVYQYRTWIRAENPLNDEFVVDGTATGRNRDGIEYNVRILTPIRYKAACWATGVFIPVEGEKEIKIDDKVVMIYYGDGSCDRTIIVVVDGKMRQYQHKWLGD
jgi:hypothetical protein